MKDFYEIIERMKTVSKEIGAIFLDVSSITSYRCNGHTQGGTEFDINWAPHFLILKMSWEDLALVESFGREMGYKPFCRYVNIRDEPWVFEWDKNNPEKRFAELESEDEIGKILGLQKLEL